MNEKENRVIKVSSIYLMLKLVFRLTVFFALYMPSLFFFLNAYPSMTFGFLWAGFFPLLVCLPFVISDLLHWKKSGVFITDKGDHIVRVGGLRMTQYTLLNGVIIANQVNRGMLDQIFGMATIKTGIVGDRSLSGVLYSDIDSYNDLMRDKTTHQVVSIL